jgi:hypothetical protein
VGLWALVQVVGAVADMNGIGSSVAHLAHLGGFAAGAAWVGMRRAALVAGHPLLHLLATERLRARRLGGDPGGHRLP